MNRVEIRLYKAGRMTRDRAFGLWVDLFAQGEILIRATGRRDDGTAMCPAHMTFVLEQAQVPADRGNRNSQTFGEGLDRDRPLRHQLALDRESAGGGVMNAVGHTQVPK